jgi:translation initiation factor IF-1
MKLGDICMVDCQTHEVKGVIIEITDEWFDVRCHDGYVVRYAIL